MKTFNILDTYSGDPDGGRLDLTLEFLMTPCVTSLRGEILPKSNGISEFIFGYI